MGARLRHVAVIGGSLSFATYASAQPPEVVDEPQAQASEAAPVTAPSADESEVGGQEAGHPPASSTETPKAEQEQAPSVQEQPDAAMPPRASPEEVPGSTVERTEPAAVQSGSGLFEESLSPPLAESAADESGGFSLDAGGYARSAVFLGKVPGFQTGVMKAGYAEFALQVRSKRSKYGVGFAEPRLLFGRVDRRQGAQLQLREAYVETFLGPVDLKLGQQIVVWGRADAFNPTNNLTPIDLRVRSSEPEDRRLGNVGARMHVNLEPVRLEGVWMPLYVPSELPNIELPEFVVIAEGDKPEPEFSKMLWAARAHLELSSVELSASYLRGYALLPGLSLESYTVGEEPPEVRVQRTPYPQHVIGGDLSTALGDWVALRTEAAYRMPDNEKTPHTPARDLQYVLGLDRNFGSLSVIAQYLGRYVLDWEKQDGPEEPLDPSELVDLVPPLTPLLRNFVETPINEELAKRNQILFQQTAQTQHLVSLRLEWLLFHETLSLSALSLVNLTTDEWLLYPKARYLLSDELSASVGGELYAGPDDTLLGQIDEQLSAGYAELRATF